MSHNTILVIDDSATIRKLVDTHLSSAGYRVILAASAEEGLDLASQINPDLILLDHQLPGTTGHNVATQLVESEELRNVPVVISSTLRKKAYVEYTDLDNVVDMLPKPYTEELLKTTIANAIETAAMIVNSQCSGGAVPEIMHAMDEPALTGSLKCFSLRELLDFLNNGRKLGVLEVEAGRTRVRIHLEKGRIQAVYAQGIDAEEVDSMISQLPPSLANLAPILKMTIGGRSCAEVDGFVQLLDQNVLDPRLMSKLLRFQAAQLIRMAFTRELETFRFEVGHTPNALHRSLPLEISLLALLVEGALYSDHMAASEPNVSFVRRAIRGQNLDRTGLSARHMKVLNTLSDPKEPEELAQTLGWDIDEVHQVLRGFEMAELVERRKHAVAGQFVVFEPHSEEAQRLRESLEESDNRYSGKVVRDRLALQLFMKRTIPHTLVFSADDETTCELMRKVFTNDDPRVAQIKRIAIIGNDQLAADWREHIGFEVNQTIERPCTADSLFASLDEVLKANEGATPDHEVGEDSQQQGHLPAGAES